MIAITFMLLRLHLPEVGLCYFILCLQLIKLKYEVNLVNVCLLKCLVNQGDGVNYLPLMRTLSHES